MMRAYLIVFAIYVLTIEANQAKFVAFGEYEYYWTNNTASNIEDAINECKKLDAKLAIINKQEIGEFLKENLKNFSPLMG